LCEHVELTLHAFFQFCQLFKDRGLLQDTIHMCVEQQVAMFFNTVGHNLRNRVVGTNFDRSGETANQYLYRVLQAIGELRSDYIRPPSFKTPTKITGSPRWDPYFKVCALIVYFHLISVYRFLPNLPHVFFIFIF
jgi:hypothetical protein